MHSRLRALVAIALVGIAAGSATAKSATKDGNPSCHLQIEQFAEVAYATYYGETIYQLRIVVQASTDPDVDVWGSANLSGAAGDLPELYARGFHSGRNTYVRWYGPKQKGKYEHLDFKAECSYEDKFGNTYYTDVAAHAKALIYGPGQPQPFLQPWVGACPHTVVIDSRGSGERKATLSPPAEAFINQLRVNDLRKNTPYVIQDLANPYPAAGSLPAMIAALTHLPWWYHPSVVAGKKWLRKELIQIGQHCPKTKVVLVGYSQGAQVTGDVFQERRWAQVTGVVLFGDPYYNAHDSSDRFGLNASLELRQTSNHGGLGQRPAFNSPLVLSFCHRGDPVCQGKHELVHGLTNHKNYTRFGEPQLAANNF